MQVALACRAFARAGRQAESLRLGTPTTSLRRTKAIRQVQAWWTARTTNPSTTAIAVTATSRVRRVKRGRSQGVIANIPVNRTSHQYGRSTERVSSMTAPQIREE